ncbi:MAG: lambda exonuclease family protein [Verrucomicrobiota bacterium]
MIFPDCTLHDVEQRTPEWHALRGGVLTASAMGVWLAERPRVRLTIAQMTEILSEEGIEVSKGSKHSDLIKLLPDPKAHESLTKEAIGAREKAIARLLGEISGCEGPPEMEVDPDGPPPRNPSLWAVWNGIRLESEARQRFAELEGVEVKECGFALHESKRFGCSPDGHLVGKFIRRGLEIKCPLPETHVRYLMAGTLPDEYRAQVHGSMAVTGAKAWYFFSYCPGLPPLKLLVKRDQFTEDMLSGLVEFGEELDRQQARICELWEETFGKEAA